MIKNKIKSRDELALIIRKLKSKNKMIGFTSGAFDILHSGHIVYLEKAKAICDVLVVAVNSDLSVKKYKGEGRPIITEQERIKIIAGLESVDFAFLFEERRNKKNISILKPNFYIKAGDYKQSELTSATYLEKDGEVVLIPPVEGISTSIIIEKIRELYVGKNEDINLTRGEKTASIDRPLLKSEPVVFLDRDGVINEEIHYLHDPNKFKLLPNVINALKKIQDMKYKIVIITNQGGIGLGLFREEDFFRVNSKMLAIFSKNGVNIDKTYFCPHSKSEKCLCRKPEIELFNRAKEDMNINMERSFTIGDKTSDILAGKRAKTKTILVKTGHQGKDNEFSIEPDFIAQDLMDAAEWIKNVE